MGQTDQAVSIYLKLNDASSAIQCCVQLNEWDKAIELATQHNVKDIDVLLSTYTTMLLNQGRELDAIELLRKANYHDKSAALLFKIAKGKHHTQPLILKKLYVLAGLEVERHKLSSKRYKNVTVIIFSLNIRLAAL